MGSRHASQAVKVSFTSLESKIIRPRSPPCSSPVYGASRRKWRIPCPYAERDQANRTRSGNLGLLRHWRVCAFVILVCMYSYSLTIRLCVRSTFTFWRFMIHVPLGPGEMRVTYSINRGQEMDFFVPGRNQNMRWAAYSVRTIYPMQGLSRLSSAHHIAG